MLLFGIQQRTFSIQNKPVLLSFPTRERLQLWKWLVGRFRKTYNTTYCTQTILTRTYWPYWTTLYVSKVWMMPRLVCTKCTCFCTTQFSIHHMDHQATSVVEVGKTWYDFTFSTSDIADFSYHFMNKMRKTEHPMQIDSVLVRYRTNLTGQGIWDMTEKTRDWEKITQYQS